MALSLGATGTALLSRSTWFQPALVVQLMTVAASATLLVVVVLAVTAAPRGLLLRPRRTRTARRLLSSDSRLARARNPFGLAMVLLIVTGLLIARSASIASVHYKLVTALVLFVGYGLGPLLVWTVVAIAGPPRGASPRRLGEAPSAVSARLRPFAALGTVVLFATWIVFAPLPEASITIDGKLGDWAGIPEIPDTVGDAAIVSRGPTLQFSYPTSGTYEVLFEVTDSRGSSSEARTFVSVPNTPPEAKFNHTVENLTIYLDGSISTDEDGAVVSYLWDLGDGTRATGVVVNHTYYASGLKGVRLRVTDDDGASGDSPLRVISVSGPNRPPVVIANLVLVEFDLKVSADGTVDPDGDSRTVRYAWDFGDGTLSSDSEAVHKYAGPGEYNVTLVATDVVGAAESLTTAIRVPNPRPVPEFSIEVDGLSVRVDGRPSTDDGEILAYRWSFGSGRNMTNASGPVVRSTFAGADTYPIRLEVEDNLGATASVERNVTVLVTRGENRSPRAFFSAKVENLFVTFSDIGSYDPDGTIREYIWDFGDGDGARGLRASHMYGARGVYVAALTVIDNLGAVGRSELVLDLASAPPPGVPPVARILSVIDGSTVILDGTRSTAFSGPIASYRWTLLRVSSGLDLAGVMLQSRPPHLLLSARFAGAVFPITESGLTVSFYVQTPASVATSAVAGIHPDFVVRVPGAGSRADSVEVLWNYRGVTATTVPGWRWVGTGVGAASGSSLEVQILLSAILLSRGSSVYVTCVLEYKGLAVDTLDQPVRVTA